VLIAYSARMMILPSDNVVTVKPDRRGDDFSAIAENSARGRARYAMFDLGANR
jgi:hypothetical protein